jgi:hypothetical protein
MSYGQLYKLKLAVAFSIRKNIPELKKSIIKKVLKKGFFPKIFFVKTFSWQLQTIKKNVEPNWPSRSQLMNFYTFLAPFIYI